MRHFGHARLTRTERPDSVNVPSEEKLTGFQRFILAVGIVAGLFLGASVANGLHAVFR